MQQEYVSFSFLFENSVRTMARYKALKALYLENTPEGSAAQRIENGVAVNHFERRTVLIHCLYPFL